MLTNVKPLYVAGGAVYPWSDKLAVQALTETRFGEEYSLARHEPLTDTLWLPRRLCPASADDRRSEGEVVCYGYHFLPRNEEQSKIVREGTKLLHEEQNFIIQAPTGWGKTVVGCALIALTQRRTLVITTKQDIIQQWIDAAMSVLGLSEGEIGTWNGDNSPRPEHKLVVGLVQSIMKGPERYPDVDYASFGLVVCDEVHRMGAEHFSQAMWWFPAKLRLGLSATPYRRDGRDQVFLGHIGEVQLTARQETMIPRIVIRHSDFKVPRVYRNGSYIKLPHEAGKTGHITKMLSRNNARNQLIAKFVAAAHRKARNTIVFSDSLAHLDAIHSEVVIAGVPAQDIGYYVGLGGTAYTGPERERKKQRERVKILPVILATYQMTSEATDVPWLDACVLGTPRSDVVQIIGRIRREYPDKPMPVVLDIVDGDSPVFAAFAAKRMRWYAELGCEVRVRD